MPQVVEINRPEALWDLATDWHRLLAQTPNASFFQSLPWLTTYWRHYGRGQRLRLLVVYQNARPSGILPLATLTESTRVGRRRMLGFPLHNWGTSYGPIGPDPVATLQACQEYLHHAPRDWDWIELRGLDPGLPSEEVLPASLGFRGRTETWDVAAEVELDGRWHDYWNGRNARWRSNVARSLRKVRSQGEVRLVRYRPAGTTRGDDDPRWDLYHACEQVARRSWQAALPQGTTLCSPAVRGFLREAHVAAARAGSLDLNLLFVGDRPAAFAYNYCQQGSVFGLRMGFDAAMTSAGAGSVLLRLMIEDSCERGDRRIDLGCEALHAKRHWATAQRRVTRLVYYPPSWRGQTLRAARWMGQSFRTALKHHGPVGLALSGAKSQATARPA